MTSFPQWASVRRFNDLTGVSPETCRYVLLLETASAFDVEKVLKRALKINKIPIIWFIQTFQKHGVRVEYATLFTNQELKVFGLIASQQAYGIVQKLLQKTHGTSKPTYVVQSWCVKKLWSGRNRSETMSPETFRDRIIG
ncbi:hypothetical protein AVEN_117941-1 [Araneus ventricosus]|uniref:Uncharacterized protein n=1 Tax=Araneus ventricosus TaxID=182803 RepID=A0A4Y2KSA6_ARAVE|nr:hypothetical protein AVEN_117941-1 [Araneus ventricosus]